MLVADGEPKHISGLRPRQFPDEGTTHDRLRAKCFGSFEDPVAEGSVVTPARHVGHRLSLVN